MKYSDQFIDWLVEEGYTHCFFVAGGNNMHLLDSVRTRLVCVPFVHEVAAAIAAEYFTATRDPGAGKAFALVTAGPGLTNTVTALGSAWMESRELLIIGGQVKSSDLATGGVRQRGIQEIDGVTLVESVCKRVLRVERPVRRSVVMDAVREGTQGRPGPVFIEVCLDAQGAPASIADEGGTLESAANPVASTRVVSSVAHLLSGAARPMLLLGHGVSRATARALTDGFARADVPVMLTWNAADRLPSEHPSYAGRPNTWGQRSANVLLQQADVLVVVGSRLGLQQTGFAWEEFAPLATVVQVDLDQAELDKGHPHVELPVRADADDFLRRLLPAIDDPGEDRRGWSRFVTDTRRRLPIAELSNSTGPGYVRPYEMLAELGSVLGDDDIIIPCSSGGAFTVTMQAFELRGEQKILTNKGLASMGYGLSGSIGAALANPARRTVLIEGDGGFAQNLQELGTVAVNQLNLKILLFANNGYASIRMTQRNYFDGAWIGCDIQTGLGLPEWALMARAYGIPYGRMKPDDPFDAATRALLDEPGPAFIEVPIDPEQTYFPKIASSVQSDGSMRSNPLHLMNPELDAETTATTMPYLIRTDAK
ncbi:MAG: thiamine pyrophosphate-binding protein [Gordonia polyisoprenivorans]|nr:thiamine pyrophosphate-binding protein [Gordonia polyisoprenivorans]